MTAILWIVGISLALFFGAVFVMTRSRQENHFPIELRLTGPEIKALADCKIPLPHKPRKKKGADIFVTTVSPGELDTLRLAAMDAAQIRISRAAARAREGKGGTLAGTSLHISVVAGYFHDALLQYWRRFDAGNEPLPPAIDAPAMTPDNAVTLGGRHA